MKYKQEHVMLHLIGHFLSFIGCWLKSAPGFLNKSPGDRPLAQQLILLQNKQTTSQCIGDRSANAKGKTGKIVCTFPVLHFLQINYWALRLCKAIFLRNVTYFRDRAVIAVLNMFNFIVNLYSQMSTQWNTKLSTFYYKLTLVRNGAFKLDNP